MGQIGVWQILLVLVIVLILFGAGKLPKVMGDFAKGIRNFKDGLKDEGAEQTAEDAKALRSEQTVHSGTTVNKDETAKG